MEKGTNRSEGPEQQREGEREESREASSKLVYTGVLTQYRLLGGITWPMASR